MEFFIFWFLLSVGVGCLASSRGRSGIGFFLLSLLLSPLLGLIAVLVVRNIKQEQARDEDRRREDERHLESIKAMAKTTTASPVERPPQAAVTMSVADELAKLVGLMDRGVLSAAEFEGQKRALLARSLPPNA